MDTAVAEEYIEYYADKYKELTRKFKFAMPLCKRTDKNKIYNAIETTSNIPAGYYITAECTRDVEKFVQKLHGKFGHKDGPFYNKILKIKICKIIYSLCIFYINQSLTIKNLVFKKDTNSRDKNN